MEPTVKADGQKKKTREKRVTIQTVSGSHRMVCLAEAWA